MAAIDCQELTREIRRTEPHSTKAIPGSPEVTCSVPVGAPTRQTAMGTRARVRAAMDRPRDPADDGEINLTAYLDIVTNIILFLLVTVTTVVSVTNIAVSSPRTDPPPVGRRTPSDPNLTITVTGSGFIVAHSWGVLADGCATEGRPPSVRMRAGGWDFDGLERCVRRVKTRFPGETRATIAANPDVRYETVVETMDAIRGSDVAPLFPDVQMSAGIR